MTADATQGAFFTHRNHYLFADYYLDRRTHERQEWREADAGSAFATITALWRRFKPQGDNEAQTEADWIRPVLEALGHRYNVQVGMQTPLGAKVPDYVLYPDETTRQAAKRGVLTEADFQGAPAVGDAKAWERPLDRTAPKEVSTLHENPSLQIDTYIRHSGLPWGILTNGRLWRLYHKDTSKKLDVYYEVDLPALIEQGNVEAFKYFWLFFRREAFMAGAHVAAAPACLDVVHDLLAGLAEQMIAMNKQKGDEMRDFLTWLERETGGKIEDLTGKSQLRDYPGDYQKGEVPLPFDDPSTSSGQSLLAILRKNARKLAVDPGGRKFQESLKKEYEASPAVLLPLKARLAATDRLIDQVVYRLYGLTEEEIAVVEGRGD